jgi:hypothetical protein
MPQTMALARNANAPAPRRLGGFAHAASAMSVLIFLRQCGAFAPSAKQFAMRERLAPVLLNADCKAACA